VEPTLTGYGGGRNDPAKDAYVVVDVMRKSRAEIMGCRGKHQDSTARVVGDIDLIDCKPKRANVKPTGCGPQHRLRGVPQGDIRNRAEAPRPV